VRSPLCLPVSPSPSATTGWATAAAAALLRCRGLRRSFRRRRAPTRYSHPFYSLPVV
jgi:hypothetical protein